MKKYFEDWTHQVTGKQEEIEVEVFSLEDYENGTLGYNIRVGKHLERNSQTGSFNYYYLSPKEAIKIAERRKEYYFEKVEVAFTVLKSLFDSKLSKTVNSAMLFETEIKTIEESLNTNKLYQKLVKDGRNFDLTNSPNSKSNSFENDRDFIKLEAQSKFLKYLKLLLKNEIALKLIGLIGDYNRYNTLQPVFYYIDDILSDYKISPIEGKQIILKMCGSVSTEWNKNVVPLIIHHLEQLEPQQKSHTTNSTSKKNTTKKEPTLKELALYNLYLKNEITKDNANDLLKGTTHISGSKLKQHYDYYYKTINRINTDTDRKNNHRLREFENVLKMLAETNDSNAFEWAKSEFQLFKNKIE